MWAILQLKQILMPMTQVLVMMRDSFKAVTVVFIKDAFLDLGSYILFCAIWWVIHTYTFLVQVLAKKYEGCGSIITGLLAICSVLLERICSTLCCVCLCRKGDDSPNIRQDHLAIQGLVSTEKLKSNITLLWFQYCKLYVVGYAQG